MTRPRDGDPSGERASKPLTYDNFRRRLAQITVTINSDSRTVSPSERIGITTLLRKPTTERIVSHVDRFYDLRNLDAIENRLRDETLRQTGSWNDEQAVTEMYFAALTAAKRIDRIQTENLGEGSFSPSASMIITQTVEQMGWYVGTKYAAMLERNPAVLENLINLTFTLGQNRNDPLQWYEPKGHIFLKGVDDAVQLHHEINLRRESETASAAELKSDNAALMERINILRKYGVKSVIAPSFSPHIGQWLVTDPATEQEAMNTTRGKGVYRLMPKPIARFAGTDGKFRSSRLTAHEVADERAGKTAFISLEDVLEEGSTVTIDAALSRDGELLTRSGIPVKKFLEHNARDLTGYEAIRAELLAIFADLVIPATMVREIDAQPAVPPRPGRQPQEQDGERQSKLRKLVLARIRYIDEHQSQIIQTLEKNQDTTLEGVTLPEISPRGTPRQEVINHLRKLPEGYKASPQARRLAWEEEGITLPPEGITYVRRHIRGTEEDTSAGHEVRMRRPSDARTERTQKPKRRKK